MELKAKITRRDLLKSTAIALGVLPLTGCERVISTFTREMGQTIPETFSVANGAEIDPIFHLLSRAGYGPWPGDLDWVRSVGEGNWIEEQLHPETIDDTLCDLRARRFETLHHEPGTCYEYKKDVLREEIARHTLLRAVYSKRQVFEVMVGFWTDHLNINIEKGDCIYLKPADDRMVVRANALGKFRNLIRSSATSPAMLVYLDGKENKKSRPGDVPNENYARELLELHTLGVNGGYTQKDVYEAARCLTGWRLRTGWRKGTVYFDASMHDEGEKEVLGHRIPAGGGEEDIDQLVDIVCRHPATADHIATKLVQRFVADDPPISLVNRVRTIFSESDGDIKSLVRAVLTSEEFKNSRGLKVKRPFRFIVSTMRAMGADTHAHSPLIEYLARMGQGLFQHPTPDGYPDGSDSWMGTLLWRWNFAFALASNQVPSAEVSIEQLVKAIDKLQPGSAQAKLLPHFIGRRGAQHELGALEMYLNGREAQSSDKRAELIGLILASPAFQRY